MTILEIEAQRARWERHRTELKLTRDSGEDVGRGGLGRLVRDLDVRLTVLPADPMADAVSFDKSLLEWLKQPQASPFDSGPFDWGSQTRSTTDAAVRCSPRDDGWDRYVAVRRHGGIEFALNGAAGGAGDDDRPRVFYLGYIVAAAWCALELQENLLKQHEVDGPFEVVIALLRTGGSVLGHLAEGWREPSDLGHSPPRCLDENVFLRLERDSLGPAKDTAMELACRIGAAWGTSDRRHLGTRGPFEGEFDPRGVI